LLKYILIVLIILILWVLLIKENQIPIINKNDINSTKINEGEKMELNEIVKKQWERLFGYYEGEVKTKCKGASEEQIEAFEKEFDIILPKAFSDSFRICDERFILKDKTKGFFGKSELYSLKNSYYGYFNLMDINKEMRIYDEKWKDEWIVFYDYETWFYGILNTRTGQIYLKSATENEYIIWANSYEEWLEMAVDEVLEHGEIRLEVLEKLLGIE